jgi:hypothetical protein
VADGQQQQRHRHRRLRAAAAAVAAAAILHRLAKSRGSMPSQIGWRVGNYAPLLTSNQWCLARHFVPRPRRPPAASRDYANLESATPPDGRSTAVTGFLNHPAISPSSCCRAFTLLRHLRVFNSSALFDLDSVTWSRRLVEFANFA